MDAAPVRPAPLERHAAPKKSGWNSDTNVDYQEEQPQSLDDVPVGRAQPERRPVAGRTAAKPVRRPEWSDGFTEDSIPEAVDEYVGGRPKRDGPSNNGPTTRQPQVAGNSTADKLALLKARSGARTAQVQMDRVDRRERPERPDPYGQPEYQQPPQTQYSQPSGYGSRAGGYQDDHMSLSNNRIVDHEEEQINNKVRTEDTIPTLPPPLTCLPRPAQPPERVATHVC